MENKVNMLRYLNPLKVLNMHNGNISATVVPVIIKNFMSPLYISSGANPIATAIS